MFPLGGLGAGMVSLSGTGSLGQVSVRHKPEFNHEPFIFAALHVQGAGARVLEGPIRKTRVLQRPGAGNGNSGTTHGLPRFRINDFAARFPFANLRMTDPSFPVTTAMNGWSPFVPGDPDDSGLPVAALEYTFRNRSRKALSCVFSFHAANFLRVEPEDGTDRVQPISGGFLLRQEPRADRPEIESSFFAIVNQPGVKTDCAWFRGLHFDAATLVWRAVEQGAIRAAAPHGEGPSGKGASLYVPLKLAAGGEKTVILQLGWHTPRTAMRWGADPADVENSCCAGADCEAPKAAYAPWYATAFPAVTDLIAYWRRHYAALRRKSAAFRDCLFDTTLPPEVIESVASTLSILKSPTCLRQADGRFWAWEGCRDEHGCCAGTCTHVWNYAQAVAHLFPSLERTLRETEFLESQDDEGHQNFRAALPIRPPAHDFHAAADGQLGGLMKLHREWLVSGDTQWLKRLWPKARVSLSYAIATWDPDRTGLLVEPHHNTYDIEFWGPDSMCSSFYLGALAAAVRMGTACGDDVSEFNELLQRGRKAFHEQLWNGEYYIQRVQWRGLRAPAPDAAPDAVAWNANYSLEARALLAKEGPKYQYGDGCLIDGLLGDWLARECGLGPIVDGRTAASHVRNVFRHNFRGDLTGHANPQRPSYALEGEAGTLNCTWPRGNAPSLPFVYSNEVWTGCEYAFAGLLARLGRYAECGRVLKAVRSRYDGQYRNPFDEYECGHWYARALAAYGLLAAWTGVRYDAVDQTLRLRGDRGDFRVFLATATGFGTVGVKGGKPFIEVKAGRIPVKRFVPES